MALDEIELRKWCVDAAIRWPATSAGLMDNERDVPALAQRVYDWIKRREE